ncbi:Type I restriction-modification system, restriction subunit R [Rubrivivax sp. A210]|uniref:type I restriction-modification system endonuclease n=1 Tax=Rubrivivax sp. A210 TaxID=2772301 RepID=UPI00191ADD12|nr:type I restriction-modification system endonuclease [Rubrivivax sp. A210]CAD5371737.1 Type I restriction-modification system, restriction subunit R [Rubrivivax sp. A210]
MSTPGNFAFLAEHSPLLADLGATAERLFPFDPASCVLKLRLLAEAITQDIAARLGISLVQPTQAELLRAVDARLGMDAQVRQLFQLLRRTGNQAAHQADHGISYREGLGALKVAREIAVWYHRSFGGTPGFKPGPFVLPDDPSQKLLTLQQQIGQLNTRLQDAQAAQAAQVEMAALHSAQAEQERAMALQAQEEVAIYRVLAEEAGDRAARLQAQFDAQLEDIGRRANADDLARFSQRAAEAAKSVLLDEAGTRQLIDLQLIAAGWDADTVKISHARGARPERGRNKAIAEWPTQGQQAADYVLFAGLTPVAAVEAKRKNINVSGKIVQAERYARGLVVAEGMNPAWQVAGRDGPWPDGQGGLFQLPFVYSSNGRPFVKQLAELSGTWFRDARAPSHTARALAGFHSPQGLLDLLTRSREAAGQKLQQDSYGYLRLRDYQIKAIAAVEAALAEGRGTCLLAMATGTGKTRTIIGLMYRLLKAERFRRILFLVDRTALGAQAQDVFDEAPLEQNQPLSKIYNVAELGDMAAAAETRVQVATVQAMVRRVFGSDTPPPVDAYDCIIVDEAHRGYALDQQMTEGELALRDHAQYLSSYRRVLDYFDAVRVGLTATPARHTSEIFGKPVFTYSYREAVADDWLIDHEPPIRYQTLLSRHGIHFAKGETVEALNLATGELEAAELDDELDFQVESFNKRVINEDFNRVICEQLAEELDPFGEEKALIFCATDAHADMVKRLLDTAFKARYDEQYNEAAVRKITGASDKVDQLIRQFKNERLPSIAITVDLLSTGIDVPTICHLVFLRRVRSRILYEQMIGRATRRCDEIGKTVFKIYDPVDIYATLQAVNTMRPLVKDSNVTLEQLIDELNNPASFAAPGSAQGRTHAHEVLDQLNQKLMRVLRRAGHEAAKRPPLQARLDELEQQWGVHPAQLHRHLHGLGPQGAADYLRHSTRLLTQLVEVQALMGSAYRPILSTHADELLAREQSWGQHTRPEDYLDSFGRFVREQINQSAALAVVVNAPKDLTRDQLREVRLLLDAHGFSEARLKAAWRHTRHADIAASIIGYIRQAALGEALLPFEQRVAQAMLRIYAMKPWTPVQRKWLDRLARQLVLEVVIDPAFVNQAFELDGGARRLDKLLGGELAPVMHDLAAHLWPSQA